MKLRLPIAEAARHIRSATTRSLGSGVRRRIAEVQRTKEAIQIIERLFKHFGTWPDYERVLQMSYERFLRRDSVIFDVGAHSGTHLQHFVRIAHGGRGLAFEPLPDLYAQIVERFRPDNRFLTIYKLALSNKPSAQASFVRAEGNLPESGLRQREYGNPVTVPSVIQVAVDTIDHVVADAGLTKLNYIKMDIEGGEIDAIRGGLRTLEKFRPIISVEYGGQAYRAYEHEEDTLFRTAESIGYAIFDPFLQFIGTRELWDFAKARYCWDYFLVPRERTEEFASPFFI